MASLGNLMLRTWQKMAIPHNLNAQSRSRTYHLSARGLYAAITKVTAKLLKTNTTNLLNNTNRCRHMWLCEKLKFHVKTLSYNNMSGKHLAQLKFSIEGRSKHSSKHKPHGTPMLYAF
jgi:hypothetical protein